MADQAATKKPPKTITIFVNNRTVELPDKEDTGAEIKAAADVPPDFQLFVEHGSNLDPVADADPIKVHNQQRFRAVSGQDVS
jgi:Multiubiquitin